MDLRKILFDNWGIKLLSLALSLTLWFYVTSKGKTEITMTVPLELRNIPQNMAVVGNVAGSLEVRVQGQERALRDITIGKKVFGILDLSLARVGENIVPISPDDIRRPSGVDRDAYVPIRSQGEAGAARAQDLPAQGRFFTAPLPEVTDY